MATCNDRNTVRDNITNVVHTRNTVRDEDTDMIHTRTTVRDESTDMIHIKNIIRDENTGMIHTRNTVRDEDTDMIHTKNTVRDESSNVFHARNTVREKDTTNMALDRNTMINASNSNANASASIGDHTAHTNQWWQGAYIGLTRQTNCMVTRSHADLRPGSIGENVAVPIPTVDRGRGDPRSIIGVIRDVTDKEQYKIAVRYGVLKGHYSRNQFDLWLHKLLTMIDANTENMISLREAVVRQSSRGQGFIKCNCSGTKKCTTNRCKCFK